MSAPKPTRAIADVTTLPLLTPRDCAALFRVPEIFQRCVAAGWLEPCVSQHVTQLYDRRDVDKCIARILNGELPPSRKNISRPK
jgi:hypothetical protein